MEERERGGGRGELRPKNIEKKKTRESRVRANKFPLPLYGRRSIRKTIDTDEIISIRSRTHFTSIILSCLITIQLARRVRKTIRSTRIERRSGLDFARARACRASSLLSPLRREDRVLVYVRLKEISARGSDNFRHGAPFGVRLVGRPPKVPFCRALNLINTAGAATLRYSAASGIFPRMARLFAIRAPHGLTTMGTASRLDVYQLDSTFR